MDAVVVVVVVVEDEVVALVRDLGIEMGIRARLGDDSWI